MGYCISVNMNYAQYGLTTPVPQVQGLVFNNIVCHTATRGWTIQGLQNSYAQLSLGKIVFANVTNMFPTCQYATGSCNADTVKPSCPPCMPSNG
uniref:Uncharacterized protein n=1 Tax=Acrobeloides nanus TaxID=290746 RepID=A0A914E2J1_9BILA